MTTPTQPTPPEDDMPVIYPPQFSVTQVWPNPARCPNCWNNGPHGEICITCDNVDHYYGNEIRDTVTLQLLARAMARIIVKEPEYTLAQTHVESLIHYYITKG